MSITIKVILIAITLFTLGALRASSNAIAGETTLAWDRNPASEDVAGYRIYYGTSSDNLTSTFEAGTDTTCVIPDLEEGRTYYYAITAYSSTGVESIISDEISGYVPMADDDGDGLSNYDEINIHGTDPNKADTDGDGFSDGYEVANNSDPTDPNSIPSIIVLIETGDIVVNHNWKTVTLKNSFTNPVIVAKPLGPNGSDPAVVRIRNVGSNSFEIRLQEWNYDDGEHTNETVSFIAMNNGSYTLQDGTMIEVGSFETNRTTSYETVSFAKNLTTEPVVIAAVTTFNEEDTVTGRIRGITTSGFEYRMQEQELNSQVHAIETISYIAWEPSSDIVNGITFEVSKTADVVNDNFHSISFNQNFVDTPVFLADMQTTDGSDTSNLRWQNKTIDGVDVKVSEEQSRDSETSHTTEVVGHMAFYNSIVADPTVVITTPLMTDYITEANENSFAISGTCSENGRVVNVTIGAINDTPICFAANWATNLDVSSLADGPITVTADHTNAAGNNAPQAIVNFNKDATAPDAPNSLSLINPPTSPEKDTTPEIQIGGVMDGNTVELHTNASCTALVGSGVSAETTINITSSILEEGSYTFYAKSIDPLGNNSNCSSVSVTYILDLTLPTVAISIPLTTDYVTMANETSFTVSGTCSENGRVVDVAIGTVNDTPNCVAGSWTTNLNVSSLADGPVTVTANHSDAAGNDAVTASINFNKDTTAPNAPNSFNLINPATSPGNDTTPEIQIGGVISGETVELHTNASCTALVGSEVSTNATTNITSSILEEGSYTFHAKSIDPAGNSSNCSTINITYILDLTLPTVAILIPSMIDYITAANENSFTISGTCSENGNVVSVAIGTVNDTPICFAGNWTTSLNLSSLADGPVTVTANHIDIAGNGAITASVNFNKDATQNAPNSLSLFNPATSPGTDTTPEIQIGGIVTGDTVELHTNASCTALVGSGVSAGTTINITSSVLEEGPYTFYAKSTDPVGNSSSCSTANVTYTLDLTPPPAITIEIGEVIIDNNWKTVTLKDSFTNPVVVAKPLGLNENDPAVIRIRNVSSNSFEIRLQEWDYMDGEHTGETVSFMVVEKGSYTLQDGTMVEAGTFETNKTTSYHTVSLTKDFTTEPVVIATVTSFKGGDTVTGRMRRITTSGFEYRMQEQELNPQEHITETISYIAWEPSSGTINEITFEVKKTGDVVTHNPHSIVFDQNFINTPVFLADMQTTDGGDTANLRWQNRNIDGVDVKVSEEQSRDSEIGHTTEVVGYMAFSDSDLQPVFLKVGEVNLNHEWKQVTFESTFTDPVVIAKPISFNGSHSAVVRIRNVNSEGFEISIQEWDYLDGSHTSETISYIVIKRGSHTLADGTLIEAGTFETNRTTSYQAVSLAKNFATEPVVIAAVTTFNEEDAVTGRIRGISTSGFEYRMQEQELNSQVHAAETISYLAWEPSSGVVNEIIFEVKKTPDVVNHNFHSIVFDQDFTNVPMFLADMQTTDGGDTANLRWQNRDINGVNVQISEEQSRDSETSHTNEVIGYMIFD